MSEIFDRCQCSGMTFDQIKQAAQQMNIRSVKGLRNRLPMGAYCSGCAPFVREMLKTGQTVFEVESESAFILES